MKSVVSNVTAGNESSSSTSFINYNFDLAGGGHASGSRSSSTELNPSATVASSSTTSNPSTTGPMIDDSTATATATAPIVDDDDSNVINNLSGLDDLILNEDELAVQGILDF